MPTPCTQGRWALLIITPLEELAGLGPAGCQR